MSTDCVEAHGLRDFRGDPWSVRRGEELHLLDERLTQTPLQRNNPGYQRNLRSNQCFRNSMSEIAT